MIIKKEQSVNRMLDRYKNDNKKNKAVNSMQNKDIRK